MLVKLRDLLLREMFDISCSTVQGSSRQVFVNIVPESCNYDEKADLFSNGIRSYKYSIISFLPKTIMEQFTRFSNIFFLVLAILQFFPAFTLIDPVVAAIPLILVLAATIAKEGFEDIKRRKIYLILDVSDEKINGRKTLTIADFNNTNSLQQKYSKSPKNGSLKTAPTKEYTTWQKTKWMNLSVGEFVLLHDGDHIPADMIVVSTSDETGSCFVETVSLD